MKNVYLVNAHGHEWHRTIAILTDKVQAIHLARVLGNCYKDAPCGCTVWEHEVNGGEGKKIYPDWN